MSDRAGPSCPICLSNGPHLSGKPGGRHYCTECHTVFDGGEAEFNENRKRRDLFKAARKTLKRLRGEPVDET